MELRGWTTDRRELVADVAVERAEVVGQADGGTTSAVQRHRAAVDVQAFRGFDEAVLERAVGRILRMVDEERAARLRQGALDVDVAEEVPGVRAGAPDHSVRGRTPVHAVHVTERRHARVSGTEHAGRAGR